MRLAHSHPGVAEGRSETRSQFWFSSHYSSQIYHPAVSSDTDGIRPIPPVVPEHFCDPVLGLSGNYDVPPWHSLEIGGICPLVDVPRRNTKREEKEHDWPSQKKTTAATRTQNQQGMEQRFSTRGDSALHGTCSDVRDIFGCHSWEGRRVLLTSSG